MHSKHIRVQSALSALDSFFVVKSKKGGKVLDSIFLYVEKNGEITSIESVLNIRCSLFC